MALRIEWLRSVPAIEGLAAEWQRLENEVEGRSVLASADHLLPWYRHYAGVYGTPLFGVARDGAELVGLAPFVLRRDRVGGLPVTRADLAGADAEAGELLVRDGRPDVMEALLDSLPPAARFQVLGLKNLEAGSKALATARAAASAMGWSFEAAEGHYVVVDLEKGYDGYCAAMSRNFRRNLKRQDQRMHEAGAIEVDGVHFTADREDLARCTDRVFAIFAASWKAVGRGPMAAHHRGFYRELIQRFGGRGMVDVSILKIDGKDAAYIVGLLERGFYYDVTLSYDARYEPLAPGSHLMQLVLQRLAAAGVRKVISHGAHEYKRRWASAFVPVTQALLFSPRPWGRVSRFLKVVVGPRLRRPARAEA